MKPPFSILGAERGPEMELAAELPAEARPELGGGGEPAPRRWRVATNACALAALVVGLFVLSAWLLQPPGAAGGSFLWLMKANTALCVVLVSASALLLTDEHGDGRRLLRRSLAAAAAAVAVASLLEYATGWDAGIDQLLAPDPAPSIPGRMSPWTAAILTSLAAIALFHRSRWDRAADAGLLAAGIGLQLVFAGYMYGVVGLYGVDNQTRVSPHTLACLSLLALAFLGARLGVGLLAAATRPTAGGAAVRVLLPVAWVLPVLLGWLRLAAQRRGVFTGIHLGVAIFAVAQTMTLSALIAWLAPRLDALDARLADERRRREELESFVAMCAWTGRIRWRGEWVSVERYLAERFGLEVTHPRHLRGRGRALQGGGWRRARRRTRRRTARV